MAEILTDRRGSPNNSMQRTALRAAVDAERWASEGESKCQH